MRLRTSSILPAIILFFASILPSKAETLKLGSSGAVAVLLQQLADLYAAQNGQLKVEIIPGLGSGGAIAATAAGALDLAISGRNINEKEQVKGAVSTPLFETPFVFVSSLSAPLSLTVDDVLGYYAGTSRTYPNGEAVRLILRPRSDAHTLYVKRAIPGMSAAQERVRLRHDIPIAGSDQDNMHYMKTVEGAFSGMSLTQLSTEQNSLQRVRINNIDGTVDTIKSGAYPLKLTMYVVTSKSPSAAAQLFQVFLSSPEARKLIENSGGLMVTP